jgi:hypothetical protein
MNNEISREQNEGDIHWYHRLIINFLLILLGIITILIYYYLIKELIDPLSSAMDAYIRQYLFGCSVLSFEQYRSLALLYFFPVHLLKL